MNTQDPATLFINNLPSVEEAAKHFSVPGGWIHPGMIREGTNVVISGAPGSGKTTFALKLADAIANGKEFFRTQTHQAPCSVPRPRRQYARRHP